MPTYELRPIEDSVVVGIDNGLSGALAAISGHDGSLIDRICMPVIPAQHSGKIPDIHAIREWITQWGPGLRIGIEEAPHHARSSNAMRSQSICYALILGSTAINTAYSTTSIRVHDWHKAMLGKVPRGMTKAYAERVARELVPTENWFATDRSTTPHDGLIDAYLIARYLWGELKGK